MKKALYIFIILFWSLGGFSQVYNISTNNGQNITTCSGTLYDSGGSNGNYSANETYTITFTPATVGAYINLDFTSWVVGAGDALEIFDGPSVSSPSYGVVNAGLSPVGMIIGASILNATGSVTLKWTSTSSAAGWAATVSCGLPCQNYSITLQSSTPPFHIDSGYYYIDVCPSDSITFTATGNYGLNDSVYHQSDATTTFSWDFGNYTTDSGSTVGVVYDTIKGYDVLLTALDSNGCLSSQIPKIRVRLSTQPDLTGTHSIQNEICQNDTTSLFGNAEPKQWKASSSLSQAGVTYLPDGNGASYSSSLMFNVFAPGQVLQSPTSILGIRATIEHSYLGDLNIQITCPNGQSATLKSYPGGGGTFLGEPIDGNAAPLPGIGYEYAWKPNGTTTMLNAANTYTYTYTNALGAVVSNGYLPPSTGYPANATISSSSQPTVDYLPETNYSALMGCPLNGAWTITVTDNLSIDNGYIFAWGIDFAQNVLPTSWDFTPVISSSAWNSGSNIIYNNGDQITILPVDSGQFNYTYTVVDNFGCTYDTTVSITVVPKPEVNLGNDTIICGFGIVTIDAGSNLPNSTYSWNTGNTTQFQQTNMTGDFIATVTYNNGNILCSNSDSIHIDQYDMADVDFGNDTCILDGITLHAGNAGHNPPFLYLWNDGSTGESIDISESGTYSVTVTIDANSPCVAEDEIQISVYDTDFLGEDQEFCNFEEIIVNVPYDNSSITHTYQWNFDGEDLMISDYFFAQKNISFGDHIIKVMVDNGCEDEVNLKSNDCQIEIPNIITPNGDGSNDKFVIDGLEFFPNTQVIIYNRWGKKVFESLNYQNDWGNSSISDGVYYYVVYISAGTEKEYRGTLTVMKQ